MSDAQAPESANAATNARMLIDDNTLLRWGIYAAIGVFVGVFIAINTGDNALGEFYRLKVGLGIGATSFIAVALICEVLRFEILRIPVTLLFFGWLYSELFPAPWAAVGVVIVLLLAAAISGVVQVYRKSTMATFRLRFFRVALPLFLCPVLWFCQNVDRCLDRGGAWNWSSWYCDRDEAYRQRAATTTPNGRSSSSAAASGRYLFNKELLWPEIHLAQ